MALKAGAFVVTGKQGDAYEFTLATETACDGTTPLTKGFYIVTAVAATTGLPSPASGKTAVGVGDLIYSAGTITGATGDKVKKCVIVNRSDLSSWELSGEADKGTATRFSDTRDSGINREIVGLTTLSGSLQAINTINVSDAEGGTLNAFFPITVLDGESQATKYNADNSVRFMFLVTNRDLNGGEVPMSMIVAPVQYAGTSASAKPDEAGGQVIDAGLVIAPSSEVNFAYVVAHNTDSLETLRKAQ